MQDDATQVSREDRFTLIAYARIWWERNMPKSRFISATVKGDGRVDVAWNDDDESGRYTLPVDFIAAVTTPAPAQPADVDSGMSGPQVESTEVLWANLPTGREWTSLATHEKALACHVFARAALAVMPVGEPVAWQRKHPDAGWLDCRLEDADHYRSRGQEVRPLYAHPPATPPADADAGLVEAVQAFFPNIDTGNSNVPDDTIIPLDVTMGELRKLKAALGQGGVR